ncbi:MAG: endolytic transglycosylase MltG [Chloroflexi bacterium]|nr:endolytic transglycosylase MltG [Chloroflexota bacterium]
MNGTRLIPLAATVVSLVFTVVAVWFVFQSGDIIDGPTAFETRTPTSGDPAAVTVLEGESPGDVGETLAEAGVIESATQFKVLVAFMGYDRLLQAGDYEFQRGTPVLEAVYRIRRGAITERIVTVIEGWRLEQIADAVAEQGVSREEFLAATDASLYELSLLNELPEGASLNGYLFPATYAIGISGPASDLVLTMLQAFLDNVPLGVRESAADVGLTFHEALTLASIIEREAQVAEERPIMAQVFLSRLALGIRLEADPTVQFAVSEDPASIAEFGYWKAGLTGDDLVVDSPYNTYQNAGLPPGPISNPGLLSILAVMNPAETNYLYFVARPDGSHAFAETFEEHSQNVAEFIR